MSDPRMIPYDYARGWKYHLEAGSMTGDSEYRQWSTIVALYNHIDQLEAELHVVAQHSLAQGRKIRAQAAQIARVREAVSRLEKKLENGTTEWRDGLKADQHLEGYTDGLDIALAEIEQALGDTDD